MKLTETQLEQIRAQVRRVKACGNPFYTERFKNVEPEDIKTQEDFEKLVPFCSKQDLRDAHPLGLATVPEEEIVRIHSSSGTTGSPVIIPYTLVGGGEREMRVGESPDRHQPLGCAFS